MAKLNAKNRNALPSSDFGLPSERKYPMENPAHAANAKARASQQLQAGTLSAGQAAQIDAKADRLLGTPQRHAPSKRGFRGG